MHSPFRYTSTFALSLALAGAISGCDVSDGGGLGTEQKPDPVVVDYPIAFVARPLPLAPVEESDDEEPPAPSVVTQDILDPTAFNPGARLVLKVRASTSAPEETLTEGIFPPVLEDPEDEESDLIPATYDVKDLEVSPDGNQLVFAMRAPEDPERDEDEQPPWNIWQYDRTTQELTPMLEDFIAEQGEDVSPHYLPDGRIVFTSTRQKRTKAILLDEGKAQYSGLTEDLNDEQEAFNLHIYDPTNDELNQLTFNPSHDLQPTVLEDGRILFLRWDNLNRHDQLSFYVVNPDGSEIERFYGYNAEEAADDNTANALWHARDTGNGQVIINLRQRESSNWGGDIVTIDTEGFLDKTTANPRNPGSGEAEVSLSPLPIDTTESPKPFSSGGLYNSAYPLNDGSNRLLTSWSPCRIYATDEDKIFPCTEQFRSRVDATVGAPSFGLWVLNTDDQTQQPLLPPTETEMYTEAVVMAPSTQPAFITDNLDDTLKEQDLAVLHIRNIYDIDGSLPEALSPMPHEKDRSLRPARFVRLVKSVPIPHDDVREFDDSAYGLNRSQLMRDILGYAAIEPDGSAKFKVPANVPFMVNIVDATGKRLGGRHENWISLQAGETRRCVSCHEHSENNDSGHGRPDAEAFSGYLGAPFSGVNVFGVTAGKSMADTREARDLSIDLRYEDDWTADPAAIEDPIALTYATIAPDDADNLPALDNNCTEPKAPVSWSRPSRCSGNSWDALCRITINYQQYIHPIFERDRQECVASDDAANGELIADHSCAACHTKERIDPVTLLPLVPAGNFWIGARDEMANQADYSGNNANNSADYITSFAQLFFGRWEWEINDNGVLAIRTRLVEREFEEPVVDENGDPVLDENGDPVTETVIREVEEPVPVAALLNTNGAAANQARFFDLFEGNDPIHSELLSPSELRLIAEWLDIGAQYYNSPFDAPAN